MGRGGPQGDFGAHCINGYSCGAMTVGYCTLRGLHRRLRACYFGVRAERPDFGSDELLDLELYLATRARGLTVETPGVRR